jgi:hypothetical protein
MTKNKVHSLFDRILAIGSKASTSFMLLSIILVIGYIGELYTGRIAEVRSATVHDLRGHVWSETIGWISLNCLEGGLNGSGNTINICTTASNYKVKADAAGTLSGYAWSDNVGWISFQETLGCPPSTAPCPPVLDANGLTGWVRVMSSVIQPGNLANPDRGGWDGWILLSSTSPVYKVGRSVNDLIGHAWGDINLGWLSFNCLQGGLDGGNNVISRCPQSNYKAYLEPTTIPDPTLDFTLPTNAIVGETKNLKWTTTNINSCIASGVWSGSKPVPDGIESTESTGIFNATGTFAYILNCSNTINNTSIATTTRTIVVSDGICNGAETMAAASFDCTSVVSNFTANPKIVKENKPTTLKWNITGGQSCKLYSPSNVVLQNIPDGNNVGSYTVTNVTGKQTYSIKCLGGVESTATVSVYLLFEY